MIVVLIFPALRPGQSGGPAFASGMMAPGMTAAGDDAFNRAPPLTGTPREQADRLFNRVMQAQSQGDAQQAAFFLPMAVLAYRQAGELDLDGLYHLSVLETAAGEPASGLATAERILARAPDHLLGLAAAAQAADALGDRDAARPYYERFLAAFDAEEKKALPEYLDHAPILPAYKQEAEAYLKR